MENNLKIAALIPARYEASRFPGKLMAKLGEKAVIVRTYEATTKMGIFDEVYVVTDSDLIYEEILKNGGNAIKSKKNHETGSDRIAEAAMELDCDIIVNIQGDEPFVQKEPLESLLSAFNDPYVEIATLMQTMDNPAQIRDPNFVKVVTDLRGDILYFSRSPIPLNFNSEFIVPFYEHIGVYAFKKYALLKFASLKQTPLEKAEKVEPIRLLENGIKIRAIATEYMGIEIDTPEDLFAANEYLKKLGWE